MGSQREAAQGALEAAQEGQGPREVEQVSLVDGVEASPAEVTPELPPGERVRVAVEGDPGHDEPRAWIERVVLEDRSQAPWSEEAPQLLEEERSVPRLDVVDDAVEVDEVGPARVG